MNAVTERMGKMIISKKKFDALVKEKVAEQMEMRERERWVHERVRDAEERFERQIVKAYERLDKLENKVFGHLNGVDNCSPY